MRWLQADCSEGIQKCIATVSSVLCLKLPGFEYMFTDILVKKCLPILFYGMDCCILNSHAKISVTGVEYAFQMVI